MFWRIGENMVLHSKQFSISCLFYGKDSLMNSFLVNPCLVICVHQVTEMTHQASCPYCGCYFFKILIKIPFIFEHQPFLLWSLASIVSKYEFLVVSIPDYH